MEGFEPVFRRCDFEVDDIWPNISSVFFVPEAVSIQVVWLVGHGVIAFEGSKSI